jgi:hypothetical protein
VEQVVVAKACTSPDRRAKPGLFWRAEGSAEGSTPSVQSSPALCTGDRARCTAQNHVQIRDDEGGHGASTSPATAHAIGLDSEKNGNTEPPDGDAGVAERR